MDRIIQDKIKVFEKELIAIRRDIHKHPETGFEEVRTSRLIADYLTALGMEVNHGTLAKNSVVGTLRGNLSGNRIIGLRADMDALFIQEKSAVDHCSVVEGKMHACGHDGHVAMLLGAARYLAENRDFAGTVRFIFQPAEESFGGGRVMVEEGLFEKFPCDAIYGMHGMTGLDKGHFAIREGSFMASGDTWTTVFTGSGGHGAMPHTVTDPSLAAAQFMLTLQTIIGRNVPAEDPAILSIGHINGGRFDSPNIIPSEIVVRGTARSYDANIRNLLEQRIRELATSSAEAFGCKVNVDYLRRYPSLVNNPQQTRIAIEAAINVVGKDNVITNASRITGSEDFSFMLEKVEGAYIVIGCGEGPSVHTPLYDFNDEVITTGVAFWVSLIGQELQK